VNFYSELVVSRESDYVHGELWLIMKDSVHICYENTESLAAALNRYRSQSSRQGQSCIYGPIRFPPRPVQMCAMEARPSEAFCVTESSTTVLLFALHSPISKLG
jgi:hypothetical protein